MFIYSRGIYYFRWCNMHQQLPSGAIIQFIYGTNTTSGDRIPNITVVDNIGTTHLMTDAAGNSLGTFTGPIIEVPINADFPNQIAYQFYAPQGGIAGDIFEISMRNWNVCNAYDNKPFDG